MEEVSLIVSSGDAALENIFVEAYGASKRELSPPTIAALAESQQW